MATLNEWLASADSRAVNVREESIALVARIRGAKLEADILQAQHAALQAEYAAYKLDVLMRHGPMGWHDWNETLDGSPLDLTGYVETFRDDFNVDTIVNVGQTGGKWWAAGHSNFGEVGFQPDDAAPPAIDPYRIENGELIINMAKQPAGNWTSGLIQTVDRNGQGFHQSMGYWEMRAKFPIAAKGTWPAFWLLGQNEFTAEGLTQPNMELDIIEGYVSDPAGLHTSIHYKPPRIIQPGMFPGRQLKSNYVGLRNVRNAAGNLVWGPTANMFDGQFHIYGGLLDELGYRQYYDGFETCRYPFIPSFMATSVYALINLAILPAEKSQTVGPQDMAIDYVRAMAKV